MTGGFTENALETMHQALKDALEPFAPGQVYGAESFTGRPERVVTYRLFMLDFDHFEDGLPLAASARFQVTCYQLAYNPAWPLSIVLGLTQKGIKAQSVQETQNRETGYYTAEFTAIVTKELTK